MSLQPVKSFSSVLVLFFMCCLPLLAQTAGETRTVGEHTFTFNDKRGVWVEQGLPPDLQLLRGQTCLHKDDEWYSWYYAADSAGKEILSLQPGAIFLRKPEGKPAPYGAFLDELTRERATGVPATPETTDPVAEGASRTVAGRTFVYRGRTWIDQTLPEGFSLHKDYTRVYQSEGWHQWYDGGEKSLRAILALGPNVFFMRVHASGERHAHGVFETKNIQLAAHELAVAGTKISRMTVASIEAEMKPLKMASNSGNAASTTGKSAAKVAGGLSKTTIGIIGGGVVAGALVVSGSGGSGEVSPTKR